MGVGKTFSESMGRGSMTAIARRTGIPRRTLYSYRNMEVDPPLGRVAQICETLGLEIRIEPVDAVFQRVETQDLGAGARPEVRVEAAAKPGGDEALEALVARIRAHWDALGNAYARRSWAAIVERSLPGP